MHPGGGETEFHPGGQTGLQAILDDPGSFHQRQGARLSGNPRPGFDMQVLRECQAFFLLPLSAFRLRIDGWRQPLLNR